jgi:hypothetical protein
MVRGSIQEPPSPGTDPEEGRPEDGVVGGKAHVGQAGNIVAEADRRTVHCRDQRHFEVPQALDDAMDTGARRSRM